MAYKFTEIPKIKLIILHIVSSLNTLATALNISHIFMEYEFVDYFTMKLCVDDMVETQLLSLERDEIHGDVYALTLHGGQVLGDLKTDIPRSVRRKISNSVREFERELQLEKSLYAHPFKINEFEYGVHGVISENGQPLLELKLTVGSHADALTASLLFKQNALSVYGAVVDGVLKNDDQ